MQWKLVSLDEPHTTEIISITLVTQNKKLYSGQDKKQYRRRRIFNNGGQATPICYPL